MTPTGVSPTGAERAPERREVGDRVEPLLDVVEVVEGAAVARRAAHVGRRHGDALRAQVLDAPAPSAAGTATRARRAPSRARARPAAPKRR